MKKHKAKETYNSAPISTIPDNILSHSTTQKKGHTQVKTQSQRQGQAKTHEKHKAEETYNWAPISTIPGNILSHSTTQNKKDTHK